MIAKAIYSLLVNNTSITDLVSTRIYPMVRNQEDDLPAITYQVISGVRSYDLTGPNGLVEGRIQVNCFADDPLEAGELAAGVRAALNGHRGGAAGVHIETMLLDDQGDLPYIDPENEAQNVFAQMMDFYVLYKE
jgi:hypothetical protein